MQTKKNAHEVLVGKPEEKRYPVLLYHISLLRKCIKFSLKAVLSWMRHYAVWYIGTKQFQSNLLLSSCTSHIPDDSNVHSHWYKNFKSHKFNLSLTKSRGMLNRYNQYEMHIFQRRPSIQHLIQIRNTALNTTNVDQRHRISIKHSFHKLHAFISDNEHHARCIVGAEVKPKYFTPQIWMEVTGLFVHEGRPQYHSTGDQVSPEPLDVVEKKNLALGLLGIEPWQISLVTELQRSFEQRTHSTVQLYTSFS
jgi:hypothetical protein